MARAQDSPSCRAAEAMIVHAPSPCRSRKNPDDSLPRAPFGRVEDGDCIVEGRDVADVRPQSSVPHSLDDLAQLGTIELDNEVDRQTVGGPRFGRPNDGHQYSSGSNQACGPLLDVTADHIEHQIDSTNVFQCVILEVDELVRAEVERLLTVGGAQHCLEDDFDNLLRKGQARYAISGGVLAITAMLLTWTAVSAFFRWRARPRDLQAAG